MERQKSGRKVTQAEAAWVAQVEVGPELNLSRAENAAERKIHSFSKRPPHENIDPLIARRIKLRTEINMLTRQLDPLLTRKKELQQELQQINEVFRARGK